MVLTILALNLLAKPGQIAAPQPHVIVGPRKLALSPDGKRLAFTYRGDIWIASTEGGKAIALTNNTEMDDNAVWSPDGKWISFSSDRSGNNDIYAVPVEGGQTIRLTYNTTSEAPSSWTPDGKRIVLEANYDKGFAGIYSIDVANSKISEHFISQFSIDSPSVSPDGKSMAFLYKSNFAYNRARYEGSAAGQIWVMNLDGSGRKKVRSTGFQHLWPNFSPSGNTVYAVTVTEKTPSSRRIDEKPSPFTDNVNRTPNIYEVSMDGKARRLTNLVGGVGTRFMTVASSTGLIAYENDGKVYTLTPGGSPTEIKITATVDSKGTTEERLVVTDRVEDASISPDGTTAVIQIHRELWSVSVKRGKGPNGADATQLTSYVGSDEQPLYAPDGKSVFFTSDRDGAKLLYQMNLETKAVKQIVGGTGDVSGLTFTPDKKSIVFWQASRSGGLFTVPLAGGSPTRIIDKPHGSRYAFSPDMKYLAYVQPLINSGFKPWENSTNIWVRELASGKEVNVSKLNISDNTPAWSVDGKYIYFTSSRDGGGVFAIPSQPEAFRATEGDFKFEKPTGAVAVNFDFTDPERRIRKLSSNGSGSSQIESDPENGDIWFINGGDLWKMGYDGDGGRAIVGGGGVRGFSFTADHKNIGFLQTGVPKLVDIRKPNFPVSTVEFRADWTRNIPGERRAAFHEFWRVYNNSFYDEYFHRRDWKAIRDRYEPLLDSIEHRSEMAIVLNMMVGELEASHAEVSGGFGGGVTGGTPSTAHLGFLIDFSHQGPGIKIMEVPNRTPGSYEKTKLKAGEYVLTVNGKDVTASNSLWNALNGESGRDLTLTVNSTPSKTGAREVTYRAMSSGQFRSALYDNRIEWRRKYVEEKSGGRLTYVHIAGMGGGNLTTFNAEMWQYVQGKEGVIIDVRENGGGNIADILLDMLERKLHMRYVWRDADEIPGPGQLWAKPTVVMHAETSFSNAEMFPTAMKSLGLAELVGMPTPGYVIYTGGGRLIDGTGIRIPGGGVYRVDGTPTENMGEKPDHMVDIDPTQYFNNQDPQLDKSIEVLMKKLPRG